jgi:hypothetical protein
MPKCGSAEKLLLSPEDGGLLGRRLYFRGMRL